jgi:hypothetical protein
VDEFISEVDIRTDLPEEQRKSIKREFRSDIGKVKDDLMFGTTTCLEEFRGIMEWDRQAYLPNLRVSVPYDLKADPFSFFPGFMYLHRHLDGKFRHLSLIDSIIPKNITLDTQALQELFGIRRETPMDETWGRVFNMNHKDFKMKGKVFHHSIHTDGLSVSILFEDPPRRVRLYQKKGKTRKKKNRKKGETRRKGGINPPRNNPTRKKVIHPKGPITPPLEGLSLLGPQPIPISTIVPNPPNTYVHEKFILDKTIVAIDPNKEDLISAVGEGLTFNPENPDMLSTFRYTKCQRNFETKIRANQKLRDKMAKQHTVVETFSGVRSSIKELETSIPTKKTADPVQFKIYLERKIRVSYLLSEYYEQEIFRKIRWHTFINTQRSEAKLINRFASIYGQPGKVIVCFGTMIRPILSTVSQSRASIIENYLEEMGMKPS